MNYWGLLIIAAGVACVMMGWFGSYKLIIHSTKSAGGAGGGDGGDYIQPPGDIIGGGGIGGWLH